MAEERGGYHAGHPCGCQAERPGNGSKSQEQESSKDPLLITLLEVLAALLMVTAIALGTLRAFQMSQNSTLTNKNASLMLGKMADHVWRQPNSEQETTSYITLNPIVPDRSALMMLERLRDHLCGETDHEKNGDSPCEVCPSGWLLSRGRCFFFSEVQRSWQSSWEHCRSQTSNLLDLQDETEMDLLDRKRDDADFLWTAFRFSKTKNWWIWPNDSLVQGHKVRMRSGDLWDQGDSCGAYRAREIHHASCMSSNQWICVKSAFRFNL
ncbi:killer cell lectin-like receptor subfamily B member 1 [Lissotriton helveticus]